MVWRKVCEAAWLIALFTSANVAFVQGKGAGWHDPNIVLENGGWVHIPEDTWGAPPAPFDDRWKSNSSTIIVLIAALREERLPATILSAVDNAAVPKRIRFGVVQQNDVSDRDVLEEICKLRGKPLEKVQGKEKAGKFEFVNPNGCEEFDTVRVFRMDAKDAAGPVFARGHQPLLVHDEDFCMQIDAHTIFKKNWDLDLLGEWGRTENEFAVLSTYPTNYKDLGKNSNKHWEMPHICGASISSSGAISNNQAGAAANLDKPLLAPLWAAGLSFSRCHAERKVPNDVNLKQVFSGEEFSRGARLWTHGYDFYSITRPIIGVYYGNEKGGKGHWGHNSEEFKASMSRMKTLLRFPESDQSPNAIAALGEFKLGTKRTLEQYAEFSGVNPMTMVSTKKCLVKYVPYDTTGLKIEVLREDRELKRIFQQHSNAGASEILEPKSEEGLDQLRGGEVELVDASVRFRKLVVMLSGVCIGLIVLVWGVQVYSRSRLAKGRRIL